MFGWSVAVRSNAKINVAGLRVFGIALKPPRRLTVFGAELPDLEFWAFCNGVTEARHIADIGDYSASDHEFVAHNFERSISLNELGELKPLIEMVLGNTKRLLLFVDLLDLGTDIDVRRALRQQLPDFACRVVMQPPDTKSPGVRAILFERRRPRVFMFVCGESMSGKTESALCFYGNSNITVVHGEEYRRQVEYGELAVSPELRRHISHLHVAPFNPALFAQFIALMPAFKSGLDVVFDFMLPTDAHWSAVQFFDQLGFFPVLCQSFANHRTPQLYNSEVEVIRQELETYRRLVYNSRSWRITAPLRYVGRKSRSLAWTARVSFDRAGRVLFARPRGPARHS
jgi:hypothetical protein